MGDEKEGPYKVVQAIAKSHREGPRYSIVMQGNHSAYLQEVVPDAGDGMMARTLCNLLNRHANRPQSDLAVLSDRMVENDKLLTRMEESIHDESSGTASE